MWIIISPWLLAAVIAGLTLQVAENFSISDGGIPEKEAENERIRVCSHKTIAFFK